MVSADPSSIDGAARRQARRHQDGGEPCPCARPVPPHHPQARHQADRRRAIPPAARAIVAERGDKSCASIASRLAADIYGLDILAEDVEDETHNTTRFVVLAREAELGRTGIGAAGHHFCFPGAQPARRALQGARRLCHQRRQHDQAGKLHGRRRILRHAVLRRRRRPSRGQGAGVRAGGTEILLARISHRRRLSRPSVPRDVQRDGD